MATTTRVLADPTNGSGSITPASLRRLGIGLSLVAFGAAMVAFAGALSSAQIGADGGAATDVAAIGLWTFGLTTAAFGTAKLGIASVLLAIIRRITVRAESVKFALPQLKAANAGQRLATGDYDTRFGAVAVTDRAPAPLLIHRFAGLMWLPMLAMAAMALYGGFALSLLASGNVAADPQLAGSQRAWVQGLQFLGEGLVLSGISFLLARILGAIRSSGGDVQESLGLSVHTLRMPRTAKVFIVLMMAGLMVEIAQLVGYAYVAGLSDAGEIAVASTFLGPLREFGLGLLLSGIVLALATIARALDFQATRITSIINHGE
jgi:hypothetical protein